MKEVVVRSSGDALEAGVLADGRLTDYLPADGAGLGEVHLGRVTRIDRNLGSAIVQTSRGEGWLDLAKAQEKLPAHAFDEGAAVIVQVTRPGIAGKGPRVSVDIRPTVGAHAGRPPGGDAEEGDLRALLQTVRDAAGRARPPALLHAPDRVRQIVVEALRLGGERIVAEDHLASLKVRRVLAGDHGPEVDLEPGSWSAVADQLAAALAPDVVLEKGGSLLIERTRALTVIDVNGHGRKPLEIDLEAAAEIAHQVRLRKIGGIVVIDFVDLRRNRERERLHLVLRRAFADDPLPVDILPMTRFGLVQMTRQRTGPSLDEILRRPCPTCCGEGRILASETAGGAGHR